MIRVAVYARVSTAEQAEVGYSIDAQLNIVEERCIREGKIVVERYVDAGISGKSMTNRPALQRLIKDSRENVFNEVYVWKTNRLARNHLELLTIVKELEENNVTFKSCSEPFESETASGKLMMNLLSSVGEFERTTIVENVKMGMKQRARKGKWNGGIVLGYKSVQDKLNSEKTNLEVVESEAYVVKRIFNLYSEGKGYKAIVNIINKENLKTKKGNLFSISGIKEIITNPIYIGKIRYNVRENWTQNRRKILNKNPIICDGEHDSIISKELWEKCQSIYIEKSKKPSRTFSGSYPLTGLLRCPECGASMVAGRVSKKRNDGSKHTIRYYQCSQWKNKGKVACNPNSIRSDIIENIVFNKIARLCNNDKVIDEVLSRISNREVDKLSDIKKQLKTIRNDIKELDRRKEKVFELYEEGIVDKEVLKERIVNVQKQIEENTYRKEKIEDDLTHIKSTSFNKDEVKRFMKDFYKVLEVTESNKKKMLLNSIINKIDFDKSKGIEKIEIKINSGVKRYLSEKEEESDEKDSSSFYFIVEI